MSENTASFSGIWKTKYNKELQNFEYPYNLRGREAVKAVFEIMGMEIDDEDIPF